MNLSQASATAAYHGYTEMVEYLIIHGADIHRTMLRAVSGGHLAIVKYLVTEGASNLNESAMEAANKGHKQVLKYLVERGATNLNKILILKPEWREYFQTDKEVMPKQRLPMCTTTAPKPQLRKIEFRTKK